MTARTPDPAYVSDDTDGTWRIYPRRSSVEFETKTLYGLRTVNGRFRRFEGSLDLRSDPAIKFSVQTDSVTTGNRRRDKLLLSRDYLDVELCRRITFTSTIVRLDGDTLTIRGLFTAARRTIPLELEATIGHEEGDLLFDASTLVDRRELGMTWNPLGMIRGLTTLAVHARLTRESPTRSSTPPASRIPVRRPH
jgi:polyisoprenoid-binding protein YceI